MNDILNIIPEKYRTLALAALAVSPYLTRAFHALMNGGGIKGIMSAIWLGTNTPNPGSDNPPGQSQPKPNLNILGVLLLAGSLAVAGCSSVPTTAYKTEKATDITVTAAMQAWGDYVAQNHPPISQELQVKAAFEKYRAAELLAIDATAIYASIASTNSTVASGKLTAASAGLSQSISDLLDILHGFGVKF